MRIELLIWVLLAAFAAHGQVVMDTVFIKKNATPFDSMVVYEIDTLLFDSPLARHILIGTTVLVGSPGNEAVKNFGYNLFKLESTSCKGELDGPPKAGSDRVVHVIRTDSLWTVELNITSNCCHSFLGEIEVVDGSILNLIYHGYGTYCSCECCFGLTYWIYREKFVDPKDITRFMINGDRRTLNKID